MEKGTNRMNIVREIRASAIVPIRKQSVINAAMAKALKAYTDECERFKATDQGSSARKNTIGKACIHYRLAMPAMENYEGIHGYIACVAQGIALGIFTGRDGSQLLYAAQIAISVVNQQRKEDKQCGKTKAA